MFRKEQQEEGERGKKSARKEEIKRIVRKGEKLMGGKKREERQTGRVTGLQIIKAVCVYVGGGGWRWRSEKRKKEK
jgi:hypothetical protein